LQNILLKYHLIPTVTDGEEALKKTLEKKNDRQTR